MPEQKYILTVPLAKGHTITLVSNREMSPKAWATLDKYLELQREIWTDDAQWTEAGTATTTEIGVVHDGPVSEADAPRIHPIHPEGSK